MRSLEHRSLLKRIPVILLKVYHNTFDLPAANFIFTFYHRLVYALDYRVSMNRVKVRENIFLKIREF